MADDTVIGMACVVGDRGLVFQIQDVIVLPEYQNQGVGTHLMSAVMDYIRAHAMHNCTIGLMAASGKERFIHDLVLQPDRLRNWVRE